MKEYIKQRGVSIALISGMIAFLLISLLPLHKIAAIPATTAPSYISQFGRSGATAINIRGLAYGNDGVVYATSSSGHFVARYDATTGEYLSTFGTNGSGDGQLAFPHGVAVNSAGFVYVADTGNKRIQKFTSEGEYVSQFGGSGNGNGLFGNIEGIAIDDDDNIYVADYGNNLIQKFDSDGAYVSQFGSSGSGNGQFNNAAGVATDSQGNVYVADRSNNRIQKFDSDGAYVSQFGNSGATNTRVSNPRAITVDNNGTVYVTAIGQVVAYSSAGTFEWRIESSGSEDGEFNGSLTGIAAGPQDDLYIADTNNSRAQKFDASGNFIFVFEPLAAEGQLANAQGITTDSDNNIYVLDTGNSRVQMFNKYGEYVRQFGRNGSNDGQFTNAQSIATDNEYLYVTDSGNNRIQKFTKDGTFVSKFGTTGSGDGQFQLPVGVLVDTTHIYITDFTNNRVQKFTKDGTFVSKFGTTGSGDGQFDRPREMAFDMSGNILVTDNNNNRVQRFTKDGTYISQFGATGTGDGQLRAPIGIATDSSGNIYIGDTTNRRIQKFDNSGVYLAQVGAAGTEDGQFGGQMGSISIDQLGYIYIIEGSNQRVQKFGYPGEGTAHSAVGGADIAVNTPLGTAVSCSGAISAESLPVQDLGKEYPVGLVDFCIDVPVGGTTTVGITFETSLQPDQVEVRKYHAIDQEYTSVPEAVVTQTVYNGNAALLVTYDITDGGQLDDDGLENGTIIDPVGLAVAASSSTPPGAPTNTASSENGALASTGTNTALYMAISCGLLVFAAGTLRFSRGRASD